MENYRIIRPLQDNSGGSVAVRRGLTHDGQARELHSGEEADLYYKSQRFKAIRKLKAAQGVLDNLNAWLLDGTITGLQLVQIERQAEEDVRKAKFRLLMLGQEEDWAGKQITEKGSVWV